MRLPRPCVYPVHAFTISMLLPSTISMRRYCHASTMYHFHASAISDGRCHETSACPVTFLGRVYFGDVCEIEIKIFNEPHDHTGHDIAFASPFTAQELLVAQRYRDSCVTRPLTFAGLRAALEQSDSKDILSSSGFEKQLRN